MRSYIFLILILLLTESCSNKEASRLYRIIVHNKQGFIDSTGKVVIQPQFKIAGEFRDGLCLAIQDSLYGYINKKGEWEIEPKYPLYIPDDFLARWRSWETLKQNDINAIYPDLIDLDSFHEGCAVFYDSKKKRYGYLNKKGEVEIAAKYSLASFFSDGLAATTIIEGLPSNFSSYKGGYIDHKGNTVIARNYWRLNDFHNGITAAYEADTEGNKKTIIINKLGQILGSRTGEDIIYNFNSGYAKLFTSVPELMLDEKYYSLIDSTGNVVLTTNNENAVYFQAIYNTSDKRLWLKLEGKYGYVEKRAYNDLIYGLTLKYSDARPFVEGIAAVEFPDADGFASWKFIDSAGNQVINRTFKKANNFHGALAYVTDGNDISGYINKKGVMVWRQPEK